MKIAIIGPGVARSNLVDLIINKMVENGIDLSTITEAYIETDNGIALIPELVFELENFSEMDYIPRKVENINIIKERTYSTKFKDTGVKYENHNRRNGWRR
jgi:hypothetical protein